MSKKPKKIELNCASIRDKRGENQSVFWSRLGVTQSGGSRYESGRKMSRPVRMLLALHEGKATLDQLQSGELARSV